MRVVWGYGAFRVNKLVPMARSERLSFIPRLMKARKAAAYLDMSESKFLELVKAGRIQQPSRSDGLVRWDVTDLDDYADNRNSACKAATDWDGQAA